MKKNLRTVLAIALLLATTGVFTYYIIENPETVEQLRNITFWQLAVLLFLNGCIFMMIVLITRLSLFLFNKQMPFRENTLLNAYSSLLNFFGPGQSGPAMRGAYLYKKHGLRVRDYMFGMLLYYLFYGIINGALVFGGLLTVPQAVLAVMVLSAGGTAAFFYLRKRRNLGTSKFYRPGRMMGGIFLLTLAQITFLTVIYGFELHGIGLSPSLAEVIIYSGAANFALFASLTPGAIGIRESFLAFSEQLHHVDYASMIAANVIDRAVYIVFLGLLFLLVLSLHAKGKMSFRSLTKLSKEGDTEVAS